jgi:radical SAM superfamily enzyme YgiQ (UPF0313 family)
MRVVFVQPKADNIWDALWVGYIGAYLKRMIPDVEMEFHHGNFESTMGVLARCHTADYVVFSSTSPPFPYVLRMCEAIKTLSPKVRTIVGGWHVTALGSRAINKHIDHLVMGEGEKAVYKIISGIDEHMIVHGGRLHFDHIPWPDRELMQSNLTIDLSEKMTGERIASFQAHRGCPFRCPFCAESEMTGLIGMGNPVRSRGIDDVLNEIDQTAIDFGITYFKFVDATFDVSADYVIEFCKEKIDRGNKLQWECLVHAALATEEMFFWLRAANCNQVNIGCESGSDVILKRDIKKGIGTKGIKQVFDWAKTNEVGRRAFFLLGMPNETIEDLKLTEKFIDELKPDVVGFTILCPYPGTEFYDHDKMKDYKWEETDEYSNDYWETEHFTNQQLKDNQKYLVDKYKTKICYAQEDK